MRTNPAQRRARLQGILARGGVTIPSETAPAGTAAEVMVYLAQAAGARLGYRFIHWDARSVFCMELSKDLKAIIACADDAPEDMRPDADLDAVITRVNTLMEIPRGLSKWIEAGRYSKEDWYHALRAAHSLKGELDEKSAQEMSIYNPGILDLFDMAAFKLQQAGLIADPKPQIDEDCEMEP